VAIVLFGAIIWTALDYWRAPSVTRLASRDTFPARGGGKLKNWSLAFVGLVYVQMLLGALVAGLHGGLIYNTWPSMDGRVFPEHPFFHQPWWSNFGENAGLAQFDHRIGAYLVALSALALWVAGRRAGLKGSAQASSNAVLAVTGFQIVLGIVTLISQAPVALAALHQATAVALFAAATWHAQALNAGVRLRPVPGPDPR
jgi:heme a synthase